MTWSIVARDRSGALGVAVASRFFAVGALCPHGRSDVGALATQALVNPLYASRGLDALARGESWLDLRVDDHPDPLGELRRLHEKSLERFQPFVSCLPSRGRPAGITDRNEIEAEVTRFQRARQSVQP